MWIYFPHFVLRNRISLLIVLGILTAFMAYKAFQVSIVYEFARLLPETDSVSINYENFRKEFGADGNVLVLSVQDDKMYELSRFNDWYQLSEDIKNIKGIEGVVSVARLKNLYRN